jgi:hypothetical protein
MLLYTLIIISILYLCLYYGFLQKKQKKTSDSHTETFQPEETYPIRDAWGLDPMPLCQAIATQGRYDYLKGANPDLDKDYETFEYSNDVFTTVLQEKLYPNESLFPSAEARHVREKKQRDDVKDAFLTTIRDFLNNDDRLSLDTPLEIIGAYTNYYGKTADTSIILLDMNIVFYRKKKHHGKCIRSIGYVQNASKVKLIKANVVGIVLQEEIYKYPTNTFPYVYGDYLPLDYSKNKYIGMYNERTADVIRESKREALQMFKEQQMEIKEDRNLSLPRKGTKFIGYPPPG